MTDLQAKQLVKLDFAMLKHVHLGQYLDVIYLAKEALKIERQIKKDKWISEGWANLMRKA